MPKTTKKKVSKKKSNTKIGKANKRKPSGFDARIEAGLQSANMRVDLMPEIKAKKKKKASKKKKK